MVKKSKVNRNAVALTHVKKNWMNLLCAAMAFVLIFGACQKNDVNMLKSTTNDFSEQPYTYLQNKYLDLAIAYELNKQGNVYYSDGLTLEEKVEMILQLDATKTDNATDETEADVCFYENLVNELMDEINSHPYIQAFVTNFALAEYYDENDMIVYTGYSDCHDAISKFEILRYYEKGVDVIAYYTARNNLTGDEDWTPLPDIEDLAQKAVRYKLHALWGKTIEYMWNGVNSTVKANTLLAMADWKAAANNKITFSEIIKNIESNKFLWCIGCKYFIRISQNTNSDNISWSSIGNVPYAYINYSTSAVYPRTYRHELGHNLGLDHEHQRPDRDTYITYHSNNVESGAGKYFGKMTAGSDNTYNSTFDFESIMLYHNTTFGKKVNGVTQITLTKKDGSTWTTPTTISATDQTVIRKMYP